jgi:hypothetical protein
MDALAHFIVGCGSAAPSKSIAKSGSRDGPLTHLRATAVLAHRRPAHRRDEWSLRANPSGSQYLLDISAMANGREQTHLPAE